MLDLQFRPASHSDIELLVAMMHEFYQIDDYPFNEEISRQALENFIGRDELGTLYLIELDNQTIGYVALIFCYSFEFHGRNAFVDELFIDAAHRGQGVGTQAMHFIEEKGREFGVNALHLEVERTNDVGKALYRKVGFADHDRHLMTKWIVK